MISSLFKQKKNKRFEYTPRHYDAVKEEIGLRKRQIAYKMSKQENPGLEQTSFTKGFIRNAAPAKKTFSIPIEWMVAITGCLFLYFYTGVRMAYSILPLFLPFVLKKIKRLR